MRTHLTLLAAASALLAAQPALAGDAAAPEKVAVCVACHGADGKPILPIYPHLAGQYASYLEHSLREYRSGVRKNVIMGAQAATLTDAEIEQLAAHYAAQAGPLHTPDIHSTAPQAASR
jgi:cytochrome c553